MKHLLLGFSFLIFIHPLLANDSIIEFSIEHKASYNLKAFMCSDGNILLTYSRRPGIGGMMHSIIHLIDKKGKTLSKGKVEEMSNIIGMVEYENHYLFLTKISEASQNMSFIAADIGKNFKPYTLYGVKKSDFTSKSENLSNYIVSRDGTVGKAMRFNIQAYVYKDEIVVHSFEKSVLHIIKVKNERIKSYTVDLSEYRFLSSFKKKEFNHYQEKDKLSVFDNISDNKFYYSKSGKLIYVYKHEESKIVNGAYKLLKSINYLQVDIENDTFINHEYPFHYEKSDALIYDKKLWIFGKKDKGFLLRILDTETGIDLTTHFANEADDYPQFISGKATSFYQDGGSIKIDTYNEALKELTRSNSSLQKSWQTGISVSKSGAGDYSIDLATIAFDKEFDYLWNNLYNISNPYWNFMRPTFMINIPIGFNEIPSPNCYWACNSNEALVYYGKKDKKWATYASITLDENLKVTEDIEADKSLELNLLLKKSIRDAVVEQFDTDDLTSTYELKHDNKIYIFYGVKGERNKIFIHISK